MPQNPQKIQFPIEYFKEDPCYGRLYNAVVLATTDLMLGGDSSTIPEDVELCMYNDAKRYVDKVLSAEYKEIALRNAYSDIKNGDGLTLSKCSYYNFCVVCIFYRVVFLKTVSSEALDGMLNWCHTNIMSTWPHYGSRGESEPTLYDLVKEAAVNDLKWRARRAGGSNQPSSENHQIQTQLSTITAERDAARKENEQLKAELEEQKAKVEQLEKKNHELEKRKYYVYPDFLNDKYLENEAFIEELWTIIKEECVDKLSDKFLWACPFYAMLHCGLLKSRKQSIFVDQMNLWFATEGIRLSNDNVGRYFKGYLENNSDGPSSWINEDFCKACQGKQSPSAFPKLQNTTKTVEKRLIELKDKYYQSVQPLSD